VAVDESALAIEVGAECALANGVGDRVHFTKGDARRALSDAKGSFDIVVVDPPRLAPTRGARDQALIAYAKIAENACRATRPGGLAILCSCSAAVDLQALTRALAQGATRANVLATVLERWFQGPDHPVPAAFGEGLYLKAVIARVDARS
jgi:23S rRNA (cytosine1962-C5)-methyltransferase